MSINLKSKNTQHCKPPRTKKKLQKIAISATPQHPSKATEVTMYQRGEVSQR